MIIKTDNNFNLSHETKANIAKGLEPSIDVKL